MLLRWCLAMAMVGGVLLVAPLAAAVTVAPPGAWRCSSDASCQMNGECLVGKCHCDPQWVGVNCSILNAGRSKAAYLGMAEDQTTWGGHPIWDAKTKLWHGYFAEMTGHCTLSAWTTNSIIVHATSSSVDGPYKFKDVVQPAWSHNPLVTRDPVTGDILIAHIGCGIIAAGMRPKNCSKQARAGQAVRSAPLPAHGGPCECPHYGAHRVHVSCQTLQIMRSSSPDGPWVDQTVAWPLLNMSEWPSSLSNPTLLLPERRGQAAGQKPLLGFNGNMAPPLNKGGTSHAGLMVSRSGSWRGPWDLVNVSAASREVPSGGALRPEGTRHFLDDHGHAEDEVLYRDSRGNLHMLMHGFYDLFPGGHGWTTDKTGLSGWEFSTTAAYTMDAYLDGRPTKLSQRERPQLVR